MAPPVASVVRRTFKSRPKALSGSAPSGLSVLRSYPFALASMSTYPEGSGVVAVIARLSRLGLVLTLSPSQSEA
jgi:hypothetical protein